MTAQTNNTDDRALDQMDRELAAWRTVNRALTDRTDECRRLRYAYNELAQVVVAVVDALEQHEQADPHYTLAARTILEANNLI
jgi:hypothetical protein